MALGDTFVFPLSFLLVCLTIPKRIMSQLPTYWYNTEAFWVGEYINVLCFNTFLIHFPLRLSYMAIEARA